MRSRTPLILLAAVVAIVVVTVLSFRILHPTRLRPDRLAFAVSDDPVSAPVFVAYEKGYFRDEAIDASLLMHTTGKSALGSVKKGTAQFATIADTVLMFAGMENEKIVAIATIADSTKHHRLLALRSRGISGPGDLRGKRIGVPFGTSGQFFVYSFLLFNGIREDSVVLVDVPPENMARALGNGSVDVVAAWPPTVNKLISRFGSDSIVLYDDVYLMTWNVACPASFVQNKADLIRRLLSALLKAEKFIVDHPAESIAITAAYCRFDPDVLKQEWSSFHFNIRLGEGFLIDLEDQARWALKRYYQGRATIPDFTKMIYSEALRDIDPAAVEIRGTASP